MCCISPKCAATDDSSLLLWEPGPPGDPPACHCEPVSPVRDSPRVAISLFPCRSVGRVGNPPSPCRGDLLCHSERSEESRRCPLRRCFSADFLERRLPACLPSNAPLRRYFSGAVVCAAGRSPDAPPVIPNEVRNPYNDRRPPADATPLPGAQACRAGASAASGDVSPAPSQSVFRDFSPETVSVASVLQRRRRLRRRPKSRRPICHSERSEESI